MKRLFWVLFVLAVLFAVPVVFAQAENPPIVLPAITAGSMVIILAGLTSLAADYFPGFASWYDAKSVTTKKQLAAAGAFLLVGIVFGLTCAGIVTTNFVCSLTGGWEALSNVFIAFVVGQATHLGAKPSTAFKRDVLKIPHEKSLNVGKQK